MVMIREEVVIELSGEKRGCGEARSRFTLHMRPARHAFGASQEGRGDWRA